MMRCAEGIREPGTGASSARFSGKSWQGLFSCDAESGGGTCTLQLGPWRSGRPLPDTVAARAAGTEKQPSPAVNRITVCRRERRERPASQNEASHSIGRRLKTSAAARGGGGGGATTEETCEVMSGREYMSCYVRVFSTVPVQPTAAHSGWRVAIRSTMLRLLEACNLRLKRWQQRHHRWSSWLLWAGLQSRKLSIIFCAKPAKRRTAHLCAMTVAKYRVVACHCTAYHSQIRWQALLVLRHSSGSTVSTLGSRVSLTEVPLQAESSRHRSARARRNIVPPPATECRLRALRGTSHPTRATG